MIKIGKNFKIKGNPPYSKVTGETLDYILSTIPDCVVPDIYTISFLKSHIKDDQNTTSQYN